VHRRSFLRGFLLAPIAASGTVNSVAAYLPVPGAVYQIATAYGVPKVALRGNVYADGSITARKLSSINLTAITANIGIVTPSSLRL